MIPSSFRSPPTTSGVGSLAVLLIWLGFAASPVEAQVGVTLCACNPAVYTFELVFEATCEETNVDGLGIENSDCSVTPGGIDQEILDFTPVAVTGVDILELDQQLVPFVFQPIRGSFRNGNTFTYSSVTATDPTLPPERLPKGFQMNVQGVNALDQAIQNIWIITFTNECGVFPIFTEGEQIGWTKLIDIALPDTLYCPGTYGALLFVLSFLKRSQNLISRCIRIRSTYGSTH